MILMNLLTVSENRPLKKGPPLSTISWRTLPCTLTICLHLRERKDRCWKFDGVTRQQRRLAVSRNLPSRNIRSWEFSIWCSKGLGKKHCGVDFQPCFQGQSSILSEIYLRDIYLLSELTRSDLMESKHAVMCSKHGSLIPLLEPDKDPLLDD